MLRLSLTLKNPALLPLLLAIALYATGAQAQSREPRVSIRIASEITIQSERLTLGDIASFSRANSETSEKLKNISLGFAPNVGAVRELQRERIALALAAAGFSGQMVEIQAPEVIFVRRAAQTVDPSLVREAVEQATLKKLRVAGVTARLVRLDLPALLEVPSGSVEARASAGGVRDPFKPFTVSVEILVDGRVVRRFNASAEVEAFAPVLVATKDLAAGSRLREGDVKVEARQLEHPLSAYLLNIKSLRGAATQSAIASGEPVLTNLLSAEIVIRPGDSVRITGESDAISINVIGEARGAGRVGDRIQVRNVQSGTLLQAIVVDEGIVRVRF
jgi:flagella basal body P-ring formation protein FlgA